VPQPLLADAGEQEHLVVHGQSEEDGEHQHRDEGRQRRLGVDPDEPAGPAALQHQRDHPVRGAEGQQVEHRGLDRDRDAAEDSQQQERQPDYAADQQRQPGRGVLGGVDRGRGHPAHVHAGAGHHAAQHPDQLLGLLGLRAGGGQHGQHRGVAGRVGLRRADRGDSRHGGDPVA
jgi:hypothetical protein